MDNQNKIAEIIEENRRRNAELAREFDPVSGMGSTGSRFRVGVSDIERGALWLPESMRTLPEIKILDECGSMREYARRLCGHEPSMRERELAADRFSRLRALHDFPYWAATRVLWNGSRRCATEGNLSGSSSSRPGNGEGAPAPSFTWHGCSLCTARVSTRL